MSVFLELDGLDDLDDQEGEQLVEAVEDLLGEGHAQLDGVTVLAESRSEGWEFGEPCPHCGSTKLNAFEASDHWYRSSDGHFEWQKHGDAGSRTLDVLCSACDTRLYTHPAFRVMYDV